MRSIVTLHQHGFVVKGTDDRCRFRKVYTTGEPNFTYLRSEVDGGPVYFSSNTCDQNRARAQSIQQGLGSPSRPWPGNGFEQLCVVHEHEGQPVEVIARSLVYGDRWLLKRDDTGRWHGGITTQECPPAPVTAPPAPPFEEGGSRYGTPVVDLIDWRIALAVGILVITGLFALRSMR